MICPGCDGILNSTGCQGCGWKTGDPWPAHRLVVGSAHPLKARNMYPPPSGTTNVPIVDKPVQPPATPVQPKIQKVEARQPTTKPRKEVKETIQ